jgi:hypothetical protein
MNFSDWTPISREENAWHYDEHPDYWQWLYFDFIFTNGYTGAAVILPRSVGSVPGVSLPGLTPEVWLTVLTPEGKRYDAKKAYPLSESQGSRKGLKVKAGKNLVSCVGDRYQLNLSEGEIGMELELSPLLPPWTPLDEMGFSNPAMFQPFDPSGSAYFNYIEFVPRGEVKGTLAIAGKKVPVTGLGYHEQGRGNIILGRLFERWYWLKFWLDDFTFIMPAGYMPPELFSSKLICALLARGREKLLNFTDFGPDLNIIQESDWRTEPNTKSPYPGKMRFEFEQNGITVQGSLKSGPMVEAFLFSYPRYPTKKQPAYLRFLAELELNLDINGEKVKKIGSGMQEIMNSGG